MKATNQLFGKIMYGVLFIILLPVGLYYWAIKTEFLIRYGLDLQSKVGLFIAVTGVGIMLWGMLMLMTKGQGLPMNAYPSKKLVTKGPYRIFKHPIYWGFGLAILGAFIYLKLSSGVWLVTPITILAMIALVWGYEEIKLRERFPDQHVNTVFHVSRDTEKPGILKRMIVVFQLLFFYLISNFLIVSLFSSTQAPTEKVWHLFPRMEGEPMNIVVFGFMLIPAFLLRMNKSIWSWRSQMFIVLFLVTFIAFLYPEIGAQYFQHGNIEQGSIEFFRLLLLSVPLVFTFISMKFILREKGWMNYVFFLLGILVVFNQFATSNSSLLNLVTSVFIFSIAANYSRLWEQLRVSSHSIANSWKEWTFGKVRVINHGFYVGFGSFLGIFMAGYLVGPKYAWAILVFAVAVILFSALWAQVIEGSEKLKRPFGYYGALVGILFGSVLMYFMKVNVWVIIGVISVVMPWVQAIGRLRCLINGCCHGAPTKNEKLGIRYHHHRSRVCGVSDMRGQLLHPTQLYAIIWLFLVGFVLLELWSNNFSYAIIFGLYLILTGIGRFVEEAYRGEAQTVSWKGLRLYQWTAILSVLIGIVFTTIHVGLIEIAPAFSWETVLAASIGGFITFFAMGVDFPYSNARFSRLV